MKEGFEKKELKIKNTIFKIEKLPPREGFEKKEFKIQNTMFKIEKLPPMEGFYLSEFIRTNLVKSSESLDPGTGTDAESAILFFKSVLGISEGAVEEIRETLFKGIEFSNKGCAKEDKSGVSKGWAQLSGLEDMAFENFEVINIYEVLVRALYINFFGSFSEMKSRFPFAAKLFQQSNSKT